MRLLTMLATAVLLAACVHDTDDYNFFVAESGVSLTYYIGSEGDAGQKDFGDPWGTIKEVFDVDTVHPQKSQDDPWETILEKFSPETSHTGKRRDEDPWGSIQDSFGAETVHTGKVNDHYYAGVEKSRAVFLAYSYRMPTTFRAEVTEVRGRVAKLKFADGVEQYVIDAPANWKEGTQLETGFVATSTKKDRPFLGVRFWRTVQGGAWVLRSESLVSETPVAWPGDYQSGQTHQN
jgi:hypothetical protein